MDFYRKTWSLLVLNPEDVLCMGRYKETKTLDDEFMGC